MSVLSKKTVLRVTMLSVLFGVLGQTPLWALEYAVETGAPEKISGITLAVSKQAKRYLSVTANPLATQAADKMLKKGGSAVDAAIAAQLVLGLVEPQSSGIAGGAFLLSFDGKALRYYDGREVAPAAVKPDLFQTVSNGKKIELPFYEAVIGGRSVGVPNVLSMLAVAHQREGKLPWATLFQPAIALAKQGFAISPRLHTLIQADAYLAKDDTARAYFYEADGKTAKAVGTLLVNPDYAQVLTRISKEGVSAFYEGDIADAIVAKVQNHPTNPGYLSKEDLLKYRTYPKIREAVCGSYRGHQVCGAGAPSSGGIAVIQTLKQLERFPLSQLTPDSAEAIHLIAESERLAFADRGKYLGDPDFVAVPTQGLIAPSYLATRSALIDENKSMITAPAGLPQGANQAWVEGLSPELTSTSHMVIVDAKGRAISMTTTIEDGFGSRQMVRGFLLNNQLTDFDFAPNTQDGAWVANRVEPLKRPRSSMSPTMVFDEKGNLKIIVGSPGGSRIIGYVTQTLVNLIDWQMSPQEAVNYPHYGSRNGAKTDIEKGSTLLKNEATLTKLKSMGHEINEVEMTSGTSLIVKTASGYVGAADNRREGTALGK